MFDRIIVINLKKRPDRLLDFKQELLKGWPLPEPIIFEGVDGRHETEPKGWQAGAGAWGCLLSHVQILTKAVEDKVNHILILEDDASIFPSFSEDFKNFISLIPSDMDGLMLGGQHCITPKKITDGIVLVRNTHRTHAYSATRPYMRKLLQLWTAPGQLTHIDHTVGRVQKKFKIYAPEQFLIGQRASRSDISMVEQPTQFWINPTGKETIFLNEEGKKPWDKKMPLYDFLYYCQEEALNKNKKCLVGGVTRDDIKKVWSGEVEVL